MSKAPPPAIHGQRSLPGFSEVMGDLRSEYDAAKSSRFQRTRNLPASGESGDFHIRNESDYFRVMEFARDLDRNDSVLGSIMDRAITNTIQDGATIEFDTNSVTMDEDLKGWHEEWANDPLKCDSSGELTFGEMQPVVMRQAGVDGDLWSYLTDAQSIQLFEGHRLRTPHKTTDRIVHGVKLSPLRERQSIFVTKEDVGFERKRFKLDDMKEIAVRDAEKVRRCLQMYLGDRPRVSLTRGMSVYSKLFDLSGMLDDAQFAALLKQQLQNALVFIEKRGEFDQGGRDEPFGEREVTTRDDGTTEIIEGLGPGTVVKSKAGRELIPGPTTAGSNDFIQHVKLILTIMGVNLGMPLVLVLMDAKETNFSGWRAAFEQAKMGFRRNQNRFQTRWLTPVLMWRLALRKKADPRWALSLERAIRRKRERGQPWFTWQMPGWPYVSPLEDRTADFFAVANHQEAPSTNARRNSLDYEREVERGIWDRAYAIEKAIEKAAELNKTYAGKLDTPVRWGDLYTPLQPKHVTMSVSTNLDAKDNGSGNNGGSDSGSGNGGKNG